MCECWGNPSTRVTLPPCKQGLSLFFFFLKMVNTSNNTQESLIGLPLTSISPASAPWGAISVDKSDIFPHTLGQQISDNLDKCPWVPVGAPEVAPRGKPLTDA